MQRIPDLITNNDQHNNAFKHTSFELLMPILWKGVQNLVDLGWEPGRCATHGELLTRFCLDLI